MALPNYTWKECALPSCKQPFKTRKASQKYCSDRCRYADWEDKKPRKNRKKLYLPV